MDQSASPFPTLHKGASVILNVFHRADLDGDGVLSREEFLNFFWDGILIEDELVGIFEEIDIHHAGHIGASDLVTFLLDRWSLFENSLAALEDMSSSIKMIANSLEEAYPTAEISNQFVTRFFMKELQHQLSAFQHQLQAYGNKLEEHNIPLIDRQSPPPPVNFKKRFPICPRVRAVRLKRQMVTQTSLHIEDASNDLESQVKKLEKLIHRLENQPILKRPIDMDIDSSDEKLMLLVQQTLPTEENADDIFKKSLQNYIQKQKECEGCLYTNIRWYKEIDTFILYELWENEESWNKHLRSRAYKEFQHQNVDCLRKPEYFNVMEIPASWWCEEKLDCH